MGIRTDGFVFEIFGVKQQGFRSAKYSLHEEDDGNDDVGIDQFLEWCDEGGIIVEYEGEAFFGNERRYYVGQVFEHPHFDQYIVIGIVASFCITGNDIEDDISGNVIDEGDNQDQTNAQKQEVEVVARFGCGTSFTEPVHQPLRKSRLVTHDCEDS